jgi:uncharacterized protein
MNSLRFPDVNVWLAVAAPEHVHHACARKWWEQEAGAIAFCRFTQLGLLRLMTTAAAMGGQPLTMGQAWCVYDRFFEDSRVRFLPEPAGIESEFREQASEGTASPKLWADAWLLALAATASGEVVTFDRALATRGGLLLS